MKVHPIEKSRDSLFYKYSVIGNDFSATIMVSENIATVFKAAKDLKSWCSQDIDGPTDVLDTLFFYHYKDIHLAKLKLVELVPNQKLVYEVLDNYFNFIEDNGYLYSAGLNVSYCFGL